MSENEPAGETPSHGFGSPTPPPTGPPPSAAAAIPPAPAGGGTGKRGLLNNKWAFLVVGLLLGAGIGAAGSQQLKDSGTDGSTDATRAASPVVQEETTEVEPSPEVPETITLSPDDFKVGIKILEKQCFGSAGCNVTFRIDPQYLGFEPIPDEAIVEVIYEVRGGEDSPWINNFTITGGQAEFDSEEFTSTSSSSAKLTAEATEVIVR